jgi:flagellar biosynthesis protein FliP
MRGCNQLHRGGKIIIGLAALLLLVGWLASPVAAQPFQLPDINLSVEGGAEGPENVSQSLQLLALLTVLSLDNW